MIFSRISVKGSEVLLIDGSTVDVAGLHAGSRRAIQGLIDFMGEISAAIDAFESESRVEKKIVALWGMDPHPNYQAAAHGEAWLHDELLSTRQAVRESLVASGLWRVSSIFFGKGNCASPVMEIARMCRMRIWLDPAAVLTGIPGHWAFALTGVDPFNGSTTHNMAASSRWEISVEGAQKIGFLDGCLEHGADANSMPSLIERLSPMLQGRANVDTEDSRKSGNFGFREVLARSRQKSAHLATGSARTLHEAMAKSMLDAGGAEVATVYLGLNRDKGWIGTLKHGPLPAESPVFAPQVFGAVVDLSDRVLAPGYLMELARRLGMVFVTSSQPGNLAGRIEAQKALLADRLGVNRAQAFWERNVITCAAGSMSSARIPLLLVRPGEGETVTLHVPGEGSWTIELLPALAGAMATSVAGWRLVPGVVRSSDSAWPESADPRWLEARPGLTDALRVLTTGVLFCRDFDSAGIRGLFQHLLGWHAMTSGWNLDDAWRELQTNGWAMDDAAIVRKTLESAGVAENRISTKLRRVQDPLPAINLHARALADLLAGALTEGPYAEAILGDLMGVPSPPMVALSGDDKPPQGTLLKLHKKSAVPFFALAPWSGPVLGGMEIYGESERTKMIEKYLRHCVIQMPQRVIDAVAKTTQMPPSLWRGVLQGLPETQ